MVMRFFPNSVFEIQFMEMTPGLIPTLQYVFMLVGAIVVLVMIGAALWQGNRSLIWIGLSIAIFILAAINDSLVGIGAISTFYLLEYSFLFIILSMSNQMVRNIRIIHDENRFLNKHLEDEVQDKTENLRNEIRRIEKYGLLIDHITGLPNRRAFFEDFQSDGSKQSILIINLEGFKNINYTYGREIGDELIHQASVRIVDLLAPEDYLARLEGAEFAIVKKISCQDEAINLAQKIHREMDQTYLINDLNLHVEGKIGIVFYPEHGQTISSLLINANIAISYQSSQEKGFRVFSDEMFEKIHRRNKIVNDLRLAINSEQDQIKVAFQPIVDQNRRLIGAEALVRWNHPNEGIIPPLEFISLAEEAGIISQLTQIIIDKVCRDLVHWGEIPLYVTINISTLDLMEPGFVKMAMSKISKYALNREQIRFEITESHVMKDPLQALNVLNELNQNGIQLLIDDFGTGHSSLSYLPQFPEGTTLKIDQSFVKDLADGNKNINIIRTIINLAATFKMDVVVEGVEDLEHFDILKDLGLTKMQGFHFSKPLTAEEFRQQYCQLN